MSDIQLRGGTAYLASSQAAVVIKTSDGRVYGPDAKTQITTPVKREMSTAVPWANWGINNDLPNAEYARYLEGSGVLSAGSDIVSRIAMGRGCIPVQVKAIDLDGKEELGVVDDREILDWLEENQINNFSYETILDAIKTGHVFSQCMSNRDNTYINRIRRTDASICRLGKFNDLGVIDTAYMSYEWGTGNAMSLDNKYVKDIKLLDRYNPTSSLMDEYGNIDRLPSEFMITSNYPLYSRQYYVMPQWYVVKKWIDIVLGVPEMKAAMFNNQMTIKYLTIIDDSYWQNRWGKWRSFTDEEKEKKQKQVLGEIDKHLSGNKNAYKSLMTGTRPNAQNGDSIPFIKIEVLDDKIKDGKLLPDSAAGDSQILFALMLNPALLGVDMPGGMYGGGKGGSNIREAFMVQILIREVERLFVVNPLMVVAKVNGWKAKYPGLSFRFPNHYLTTLDTGKNAQPIM